MWFDSVRAKIELNEANRKLIDEYREVENEVEIRRLQSVKRTNLVNAAAGIWFINELRGKEEKNAPAKTFH